MSSIKRRTNSRRAGRGALWGALLAAFGFCGCQQSPPVLPANAVPAAATSPATTPAQVSVRVTPKAPKRPTFDGDRALASVKKQCDFGPRPVGSEAHEKAKDYLIAQMKKYADKTFPQEFKYRDMPVTNIVGVFYPEGSDKPSAQPVVLLAHWDTRPVADGPNSSETKKGTRFRFGAEGWKPQAPIPGANDGASGAAVLLELARLFKEKKPPVGVLLLLVDGEDYGDFRAKDGEGDGVFLGSRYFAAHFQDKAEFGRPTYGILLDMVGAKGLILPRENSSQQYAPGTNEKVFGAAQLLGYGSTFLTAESQSVEDDHMPLNLAGIPTIDLIHPLPFGPYQATGYRFWHTLEDTPDKCSARSLKIVGETLAEVIYKETPER